MKKKFTVYGNCQSTVLADCLQRVKSFKNIYQYYRIPFCHRMTSNEYKTLAAELNNIDLLITQPVSTQFRGGGFDSDYLSRLAKYSIGFPSLQFYGYFPSLSRFTFPKMSTKEAKIVDNNLLPFAPLTRDSLYHYNEIRSMFFDNYSSSQICYHLDLGSFQQLTFEKCLQQTLQHLKEKEDLFNLIPISDYLESMWQKKLLFYTPRHPSGSLIAEVVKRICINLDLPVYDDELAGIRKRDHFSQIKLYIPKWIREKYLGSIGEINDEHFFSMTATDTVSLYVKLYLLFPSALHA